MCEADMKRAIIILAGIILAVILLGGAVYLLFPAGKPEIPEIKSITNSWGNITADNSEIKTNIVVSKCNSYTAKGCGIRDFYERCEAGFRA